MMDLIELKRDMAVTHDEFYRLINKTISNSELLEFNIINSSVSFPFLKGEITIFLEKQKIRKIASMTIAHTPMNFKFMNLSKDEVETYIQKFNITFQKGGG
ncbi:MAG: hypothetical protein DHS20C09_18720 [marine bacterium B5-7]|nr:MAG: hypothetical protein DHS20C09_18720 [marine bacterium B5-7]